MGIREEREENFLHMLEKNEDFTRVEARDYLLFPLLLGRNDDGRDLEETRKKFLWKQDMPRTLMGRD